MYVAFGRSSGREIWLWVATPATLLIVMQKSFSVFSLTQLSQLFWILDIFINQETVGLEKVILKYQFLPKSLEVLTICRF